MPLYPRLEVVSLLVLLISLAGLLGMAEGVFSVEVAEDSITLRNSETKEYVWIDPVKGGATMQVTLLSADGHLVDTIQNEAVYYPSSMLIPWPNRIKDGKYTFESKDYQVPINEKDRHTSLHGLLYKRKMAVKSQATSADHAEVTLTFDFDGTDPGYPFLLSVDLIFRLFGNRKGYECEVVAINKGESDLPFAVGWHPYWRVTKKSGQVVENLINTQTLQIVGGSVFVVDERLIPIGTSPMEEGVNEVLHDKFFDTGYWLTSTPTTQRGGKPVYETHLKNNEENLELVMWQESEPYPYLQVYTPPSRSSIAIEPMSHRTNAFNTTGGAVLKPDAANEFRGKYGVYLV